MATKGKKTKAPKDDPVLKKYNEYCMKFVTWRCLLSQKEASSSALVDIPLYKTANCWMKESTETNVREIIKSLLLVADVEKMMKDLGDLKKMSPELQQAVALIRNTSADTPISAPVDDKVVTILLAALEIAVHMENWQDLAWESVNIFKTSLSSVRAMVNEHVAAQDNNGNSQTLKEILQSISLEGPGKEDKWRAFCSEWTKLKIDEEAIRAKLQSDTSAEINTDKLTPTEKNDFEQWLAHANSIDTYMDGLSLDEFKRAHFLISYQNFTACYSPPKGGERDKKRGLPNPPADTPSGRSHRGLTSCQDSGEVTLFTPDGQSFQVETAPGGLDSHLLSAMFNVGTVFLQHHGTGVFTSLRSARAGAAYKVHGAPVCDLSLRGWPNGGAGSPCPAPQSTEACPDSPGWRTQSAMHVLEDAMSSDDDLMKVICGWDQMRSSSQLKDGRAFLNKLCRVGIACMDDLRRATPQQIDKAGVPIGLKNYLLNAAKTSPDETNIPTERGIMGSRGLGEFIESIQTLKTVLQMYDHVACRLRSWTPEAFHHGVVVSLNPRIQIANWGHPQGGDEPCIVELDDFCEPYTFELYIIKHHTRGTDDEIQARIDASMQYDENYIIPPYRGMGYDVHFNNCEHYAREMISGNPNPVSYSVIRSW
eukprot:CAMPEP_0177673124 /NCGR_PEP_ID=MMETSP0447-20121125/25754_1 /TAXON_ID=0 /ORGANISM="Stygamoeba regulata, Strain BSH-02190019" /LENGTH=649 /DNA_ID=CAMNT_0019180931 /DNA_START=71 /DNA_END=2017 /DNA_ORIENTATION=-